MSIVIECDHLKVVCKGEVVIDKQLHALINLEKSKYEIRKSKIDIVLWKCEQSLWPSIEGDGLAKPKSIKQPIRKFLFSYTLMTTTKRDRFLQFQFMSSEM